MKKIKIMVTFILILSIISSISPALCYAQSDDFYAQYSGSTDASWGYKPYCTFTINKIVGNRFRGTVSAQNMDSFLSIQILLM